MPILTAKRSSPCAVCGLTIMRGEEMMYSREMGARHVTCVHRPAERRYNQFQTDCSACGIALAKGEGHLRYVEQDQDGVWKREWKAVCVDLVACTQRMKAQRAT